MRNATSFKDRRATNGRAVPNDKTSSIHGSKIYGHQ